MKLKSCFDRYLKDKSNESCSFFPSRAKKQIQYMSNNMIIKSLIYQFEIKTHKLKKKKEREREREINTKLEPKHTQKNEE